MREKGFNLFRSIIHYMAFYNMDLPKISVKMKVPQEKLKKVIVKTCQDLIKKYG